VALAVTGSAWASRASSLGPPCVASAVQPGVEGRGRGPDAHATACGTLSETRRSPLLARPLVFQGTFLRGRPRQVPARVRRTQSFLVIYNDGAINVSTDGGKQTEAFDVGDAVTRAQGYFSGPRALQNLQRDFAIEATETADGYALELSPVAGRFARGSPAWS